MRSYRAMIIFIFASTVAGLVFAGLILRANDLGGDPYSFTSYLVITIALELVAAVAVALSPVRELRKFGLVGVIAGFVLVDVLVSAVISTLAARPGDDIRANMRQVAYAMVEYKRISPNHRYARTIPELKVQLGMPDFATEAGPGDRTYHLLPAGATCPDADGKSIAVPRDGVGVATNVLSDDCYVAHVP